MSIVIRHGLQNVKSGVGNNPTTLQHDATVRVGGTYNANSLPSVFTIRPELANRPGRYVILKATSIAGFNSLDADLGNTSLVSIRAQERLTVQYPDGIAYDCLVITMR